MPKNKQPASAAEVVSILGPVEDNVGVEILHTGATAVEVLEGFAWVNADDQIGSKLEHGPRRAVIRLYEIFTREEPDESDRPSSWRHLPTRRRGRSQSLL